MSIRNPFHQKPINNRRACWSIFPENQWGFRNDTFTKFNVNLFYGVHIASLYENSEKMICKLNLKIQYGEMIYFAITFLLWDIEYHYKYLQKQIHNDFWNPIKGSFSAIWVVLYTYNQMSSPLCFHWDIYYFHRLRAVYSVLRPRASIPHGKTVQ